MKVLLLYPEFPDTFWSFKHVLKFIRKRASLPPLGLLTVAAMLPEAWEKRLVDVNVRPLREKDLAWADVVMISAMIAQRDSAVQLIARCRAAGRTIVAGGPLFTVEHAQFPDVDHFVLNEAETTLPEFLRDFAQGRARRVYTSTDLPELGADAGAAVGAGQSAALCVDERAVLARLSVRLRFLQRHVDVRAPAAREVAGPDHRRTRRPLAARLARHGVLRRRQFHRQPALAARRTCSRR